MEDEDGRTVYELDDLVSSSTSSSASATRRLSNRDVELLRKKEPNKTQHLKFESRFEGGNLRKAVQVIIVILLKNCSFSVFFSLTK